MKYSVIINDQLAQSLRRCGYAVADFLNDAEAEALVDEYHHLSHRASSGFFASIFSSNLDYRKAVDAKIKQVFTKPLGHLAQDFQCLLGSFLEKPPAPIHGDVPLHQDWSFVDESCCQSLNFWCPLVEVNEENGCLWVLPGSHRFPTHPRAPFGRAPLITAFGTTLSSEMVAIPMKKGQVLIHDHRLWHASHANQTQSPRLAAACVVVPHHAEVIHYCENRNVVPANYDRYQVDEAFFNHYQIGRLPPDHYASAHIPCEMPKCTSALLENCMAKVRDAI